MMQQLSMFDQVEATPQPAVNVPAMLARLALLHPDDDEGYWPLHAEIRAVIGWERIEFYFSQAGKCDICKTDAPKLVLENYDGDEYAWHLCPACASRPRPAASVSDWRQMIQEAGVAFNEAWPDDGDWTAEEYYAAQYAALSKVPEWTTLKAWCDRTKAIK